MRINSVSIDITTIDGTGPYNQIGYLFGQGFVTQDPHKQKIDNLLRLWNIEEDEEEIIYQIPIIIKVRLDDITQHLNSEYIVSPDTENLVIRNVLTNSLNPVMTISKLHDITFNETVITDNINIIHIPDSIDVKVMNLKTVSA